MNSRRGVLQPLVTQHAKATVCVPQVTAKEAKHAKNKLKKPCIAGVNAKVKVQLTTSKLSWTHKFPQSEMFSPCTEIKKQTEFVNFSTVYLYIILLGFCAEWHWFGNNCCDIVRSSLVNHQNHSLNRRIKPGKLLSTTGSLGITNTCTKTCNHISSYAIIEASNAYGTGGATMIFFHSRALRVIPRGAF